ncbi:MAG: zf-HC2 domain-containing protein, partial [Phycisphaerales bacterium]|nr:zf-HC2 domain-containing protein [Phycisphaerales bacterium]
MTKAKRSLRRRIHSVMFKLPLMISCREFEAFIVDYLDDQLPARQRKIFEFHLKICRECRDYLAAY